MVNICDIVATCSCGKIDILMGCLTLDWGCLSIDASSLEMTWAFCCYREQSYMESVVTFLQDVVPQVTFLCHVFTHNNSCYKCLTALLILVLTAWVCSWIHIRKVTTLSVCNKVSMRTAKHLFVVCCWWTRVSHNAVDKGNGGAAHFSGDK